MAGEQAIESAFAYHEPPIDIILNQSGLLIVLNLVNVCLDKLVYCGLIGQLFIGILWGTPGAKWLDREMETFIQQLGYLGLIMLVYEGGLSTSIKTLRANMLMSLSVAITGICAPMGLSFILVEMVDATPVQAFAAGAALSATSLGTTFTILSTTQLISTRLGIVTTSAAMLDDVVGLVMVKIISNLGGSADSFTALTVIRPVFVSIGFGVGCLLLCLFIFRPILRKLLSMADKFPRFMGTFEFAFIVHTCILVGVVGGATYAGTSSLFAAYLVGVMISWFDSMAIESRELKALPPTVENSAESLTNNAEGNAPPTSNEMSTYTIPTGERVYEKYYKAPVQRILIPLFFASIGFAIPITEMFQGQIVWRGIVYAILMCFGKLITGLWLVRVSPPAFVANAVSTVAKPLSNMTLFCRISKQKSNAQKESQTSNDENSDSKMELKPMNNSVKGTESDEADQTCAAAKDTNNESTEQSDHTESASARPRSPLSLPPKPKSLYPPAILGLAMVSRGEIGYLIASLAESQGMFSNGETEGSSETYLVIIWAISLCTLFGPICVGTLVKRVKKLQQQRVGSGAPDPLGVWGI